MSHDQETLELLESIAIERAQAKLAAVEALEALPNNNVPIEEASYHVVRWHDSYSRMSAVLALRPRMRHHDWLTVLGEAWPSCDNIRNHLTELRTLLGSKGPLLPMMTEEERAVYHNFPDRVTIYRGCSAGRLTGASWTLDEHVARKFPFLARYRAADPVLVTATVRKQNILAVLLGRDEQEIVTFKAGRVSVERLEKDDNDACDAESLLMVLAIGEEIHASH